jgi:TrpR family trp operon transcriptional repressor
MDTLKPIVQTIQDCKSSKELEELLSGLLTPVEIEQMNTRLRIIKMLKDGVPQHKIAKDLGIGVATVTRGSKMLQEGKFKTASWG